jgi:hypothetical protein
MQISINRVEEIPQHQLTTPLNMSNILLERISPGLKQDFEISVMSVDNNDSKVKETIKNEMSFKSLL